MCRIMTGPVCRHDLRRPESGVPTRGERKASTPHDQHRTAWDRGRRRSGDALASARLGRRSPLVVGGSSDGVLGSRGSATRSRPRPWIAVRHRSLDQLRDLAEYKAAQANFEVIIDTRGRRADMVPQFIAGERVQFVGRRDRGRRHRLRPASVRPTSRSTQTGPRSRSRCRRDIGRARSIDPEQSHVMTRDRGLVDRVGGAVRTTARPASRTCCIAPPRRQMRQGRAATRPTCSARAGERAATGVTALVEGLGVRGRGGRLSTDA